MKRLLTSTVLSLALSLGVLAQGKGAYIAPVICPEPQFSEISPTDYVPLKEVTLSCPDDDAPMWAQKHLREWYGEYAPRVVPVLGRKAGGAEGEYELEIGQKEVKIKAGTLQGVRYALYSLRQLAIPSRGTTKVSGWIVPIATVKDRPGLAFRGIHICWFHETEPWEVERLVRLAAYYKLNYAVIEPWGSFKSDVAPWYGWPDGSMTKEEVSRIKKIADDLGITLIPQINVFGHATMARGGAGKHAGLDFNPEYQPLFEPSGGWNWCLSNPEATKLIQDLISELHEAFGNPPYFHIGGDEANPPSCPECIKHPYSELFLNHIKAIRETVAARGAKAMMWHDMLLERGDSRWNGFYANGTPQTAAGFLGFPKDIVICDWFYGGAKDSYPTLDYFRGLGFPTLTCPWMDRKGTVSQGRYAHEKGMDGVLGTLWHHYFGEDLVSIYFTLANAAWKKEPSYSRSSYLVQTHLRQVGWDMKVTDPRRTGVYYDEIPPEPFLDN